LFTINYKKLSKDFSALDKMMQNLALFFATETSGQSKRLAYAFKNQLIADIKSQRWVGAWKYSEVYEKWLKKTGQTMDFWRLEDSLIHAFEVKRFQYGYRVGINKSHSGFKGWNQKGRYPVHKYAHSLEFGDPANNQPARPMFFPSLREFVKGVGPKIKKEMYQSARKKWKKTWT